MEKYFQLTSNWIYSRMKESIDSASKQLKSTRWRDGSKPQDKQLLATQNATKELEDLYEDYIQYHLQVVRKLNHRCPLTKECLNVIQLLRKKGIIAAIKVYYPELGILPPVSKSSRGRSEGYSDTLYGIYGRDWAWAQIGVTLGKIMLKNVGVGYEELGLDIVQDDSVERIGHMKLDAIKNQDTFDSKLTTLMVKHNAKKSVAAARKTIASKPAHPIAAPTYGTLDVGTHYTYTMPKMDAEPAPKEDHFGDWDSPIELKGDEPIPMPKEAKVQYKAPEPKSYFDMAKGETYAQWIQNQKKR